MGIELPPELADVAAQAGVAWPEADEEAMARSAQAWRDAAERMTALTSDADNTARTALNAVRGETGAEAERHWAAFVEPDSGHLTSTVRGMTDAADRLDHAARQVGAAKVEIVRNLVNLAQNADAAHSAAAAGHPMALVGLDTVVRGTSANVAHIEASLVGAVRPASGVDMSAVVPPVNANPGAHGPAGLVDTLASVAEPVVDRVQNAPGLVAETAHGVSGAVADGAHGASGVVAETAYGVPGVVADGAHGASGVVTDVANGASGVVADAAHGAPGVVTETVRGASGALPDSAHAPGVVTDAAHGVPGADPARGGPGPGGAPPGSGGPATGVTDLVGDTVGGVRDVADEAAGRVLPEPPGHAASRDPDVTGPLPIGGGPANLRPDPLPDYVNPDFSDDRPTPPTGTTVRAGFDAGPAAAPANLPPAAPPVGGVPASGAPGVPAAGGPALGGGPAFGGGPAGGIPAAGAAAAGPRPVDAAPPVDSRPKAAPAPGQPAGRSVGVVPAGPGAGPSGPPAAGFAQPAKPAAPAQPAAGHPGTAPAQPGTAQPGQPADQPAPVQPVYRERDEVLALFWVHMFPIGHMPVAADRPARQVPPPPPELDYAAGLRFEPGDHPRTDLVDSTERLAALRDGAPVVEPSEPLGRDDLTALTEGHDPLGGGHERDWDRRYQVRFGSVTAEGIRPDWLEFAWPPGEQYPEGGSADGEAEVLDEGVEIDRFGRPEGRVFAAAGTRFAQRSLPPAHLDLGYRRYRVLRPLPVWRAVSAAWFAQPGGGVRYRTTHSAIELVALGYLADITREEP